ncbi:Hemicentin-2 [Dissostichus eleginoides]|uniref:Hemicentin-2 n=1 Tax=Dissostichus eleginoides TaxID=100907 RepID=A0AAD9FJG5_DISEL|nr:Hemicentin-2 [Dissostichus eleginoides]
MPYKADPHLISRNAIRLTIQAPVSSVRLASECLSQGEKRVSCSSGGGDSPQYSWTLGGRSLTDTELLSVNTETNSITLRQHVSGAVACSVRNDVSQVSHKEEISSCGFIFINCSSNGTQISQWVFAANNMLCIEPTTTPPTTIIPESSTAADHSLLVCAVRAAVVVFALIGIAVYFAWKNKNCKKAEGSAYRPEREHQDESVVMVEIDGTFRLNNLSRNDSAEYKFEISDGIKIKEKRSLRLTIQAPVSSVRLASECLSQGEKRVSCSSGGGQSSVQLDSGTETNSITLRQHVSGAVACSVRNNVSQVSKKEEVSNCGFIFINCSSNGTQISQWVFAANNTLCVEPTTTSPTTISESSTAAYWPIMAGVLSALVLLLVVGVAVICAQRKKSNQPTDEDEQELTYAVVKIKQRSGRQVQQRAEPEVEYGQVKFSERPRPTADPAGEECVYAKVRSSR